MQKWKIAGIVLMLCAVNSVSAQQESYKQRALQYIGQYKELAIIEQRRSGVPAAITLAQGIHETSAGASELATNANNHFGIKCKKEWTGPTYSYTDDAPDECFRKYAHPIQSYKDHSDYLVTSKRYESLFKLAQMDYKGWAAGLKKCGYATNPKYAQILIKIVEDYNLQDFTIAALEPETTPGARTAGLAPKSPSRPSEVVPDQDAMHVVASAVIPPVAAAPTGKKKMGVYYGDRPLEEKKAASELLVENPTLPIYDQLVRINDLRAFYAKKGTVLLNEAIKHNIRYAKLLELNDLPDAPLEADMYIYLEKKHTTGNLATYTVQPGETLTQIAQKEGIQLKYLKAYNKIGANEEPMPGAVLQLLDYAVAKPPTQPRSMAPQEEVIRPAPVVVAAKKAASDNYITKKEIKQAQNELREELTATPQASEKEIAGLVAKAATAPKVVMEVPTPEVPEKVAVPVEEIDVKADGPESATEEPVREEVPTPEVPEKQEEQPLAVPAANVPPPVPANEPVFIDDVPNATDQKDEELIPVKKEEIEYAVSEYIAPVVTEETAPVPPTPDVVVPEPEAIKTEEVNIAREAAVEETKEIPKAVPEGPEDEFSRLKSKLDKVVYSSDQINNTTEAPATVKDEPKKEVNTSDDPKKYYKVKKGDTVFNIAKRHNISMKQLRDWNKLEFEAVKAGQQLRVKP